jgi:predicted Fe-Mo cluster-binding NifX family protein
LVTLAKFGRQELRTAVLVMSTRHGATLCPLFAKCDGILLIEPDGSRGYYPNAEGTAQYLSELVLDMRPDRLVCGFIATIEKEVLRSAGIDIRVGSCPCPVDEFVGSFSTLPAA